MNAAVPLTNLHTLEDRITECWLRQTGICTTSMVPSRLYTCLHKPESRRAKSHGSGEAKGVWINERVAPPCAAGQRPAWVSRP